jgi:hypothetical protein
MKHAKLINGVVDAITLTGPQDGYIEVFDDVYAGFVENADGSFSPPAVAPTPYAPSDLTPRRFEWLLAFTGLGDVWDALAAELKSTDRAMFAQLKAQRSALSFSQDKTLRLIAMFAETAQRVAPDADLSDKAIKDAWKLAERVQL